MAEAAARQPASSVCAEVDGNKLSLLADGPERLDALISLIDQATSRLRLLYYIFKNDVSGHRVRDALLAACNRGVKVDILVDGFGTEAVPDAFFKPLIASECRFCRFEPRLGRRYLLRNHQKLVLADEDKLLSGGFNISDDYFGTVEEGAWRDLGFLVEGPGVRSLAAYFDDLFAWARTQPAPIRQLRRLLQRHSQRSGRFRWLFGGPTRRLSPWAQSVKRDMFRARRLDLVAAYFAPSPSMLRRIYGIALRGEARLITAAKSDNGATIGAARHTYWGLLRRGTEIYEYQPTKLHTKLIVIDHVVHLGSANFDMRSLYLNLEMMLRIEDKEFAQALDAFVDGEAASSRRISRATHNKQRTWFNRLKWALCYFVVATVDYTVSRRLNFGGERLGS